ncbi:hypothetical protein [Halobaculum lipolyticum]|uniref:Uncharacterized protein n=1 Tax=Halobaculum lipolyticum TaxID=3032001 RepID=A0ABD5WFR0_9EURY|nr:hypothetical protein [Halobaculum sp. DT31]
MAGRYGNLDYPRLTKLSVLGFLSLFVVAVGVNAAVSLTGGSLPGWEETLLLDVEMLSVLGIFLSVFVFGIALPLTE